MALAMPHAIRNGVETVFFYKKPADTNVDLHFLNCNVHFYADSLRIFSTKKSPCGIHSVESSNNVSLIAYRCNFNAPRNVIFYKNGRGTGPE